MTDCLLPYKSGVKAQGRNQRLHKKATKRHSATTQEPFFLSDTNGIMHAIAQEGTAR